MARFFRSTEQRARYGIDTELNRWQIFSISLFYCFPINQFRCSSSTEKKAKRTSIAPGEMCVDDLCTHSICEKAKGLISPIHSMGFELDASPLQAPMNGYVRAESARGSHVFKMLIAFHKLYSCWLLEFRRLCLISAPM